MKSITKIIASEIIDSRGNPTIEVEITINSEHCGRAAVPSGASTGEYEALELRDKEQNYFLGKGVLQAVSNVNNIIAPALVGKKDLSQLDLDNILLDLDGTDNKSKLGANAILGVSLAYASSVSKSLNLPLFMYLRQLVSNKTDFILPCPMINILNGGAHADNNLDLQEFMVIPAMPSFKRSLQAGCEIFHCLKDILKSKNYDTAVGDEGGFAPNLSSNKEALDLIMQAIVKAGYQAGENAFIALDAASSEFYQKPLYLFASNKEQKNLDQMIDFYKELLLNFPIVSIEDGLDQNDWSGWQKLTTEIGSRCQLVGDDLLVTNPKKLTQAINDRVSNAILIKLNQIGTLSETLDTIKIAQQAGYGCIISHRSGETEDTFIADLAVATNAKQIKTGSTSRSERVAKYNQLLRIEKLLGDKAVFKGKELWESFKQ